MMRRFLWLGLLFLSASWLFFIPQFTIPDTLIGGLFITIGVLCTIAGVSRDVPLQIDNKYALLLFPLLLALLVVPFPYNIGFLLLSFGLLLAVLCYRLKRAQAVPISIILAGIILLLQTAIFPFYMIFISHGHHIDLLSPIISWVGGVFGLHTSTTNGLVFIQTIQHTVPITTTWENLGIFLWLNIFLGALLMFFFSYKKRKFLWNTAIFLLTSTVYLILRYIAVLSGYLTTSDLSLFWNPLLMTSSFLPFALLLMKLLPFQNIEHEITQLPPIAFTKKHLAAFSLVFLLVFSVVGVSMFQDPGTTKNGLVLIDEYHSQWEDTTRPLDIGWYGLLSTYNYYSWAQWLNSYYGVTKNTNRTLTAELLTKYDILILKCPTQSYSLEEIHAIKDFVSNGGGLYLIGDHTNVFGMNTFLNQVSEQFGIRFNTDATYELGTGNLSIYQSNPVFSHPVMRHVNEFEFMTSCTVEPTSLLASAMMENIIIGNRVTSEPGTYATENFFRESVGSPDSEFGYLLQSAAMKYGRGRIIAFTDSTVFSSFCIFTDGYPSFTLGVMEYLNRTNTYASLNFIFIIFAIVSGALVFWFLWDTKKIKVLWVILFAGVLAFSISMPFFSYLTDSSYPLPSEKTPSIHVCFEQQHSSFQISVKPTAVLESTSDNYGTFYVWTQRVGCVPFLENTLSDAITHGDIIVIINPTQSFTEQEIQMVTTYLEQGGRVLLMDSITNKKSTANELIGAYGIWITTVTDTEQVFENDSTISENFSKGALSIPSLSLTGGKQLLLNAKNLTKVSTIEFLNKTTGSLGRLVVLIDSYSFCDTVMGGTFTEPTDEQKEIYNMEFFLFNTVLKQ
jgi:hypothetical protein